MTTNTVPLAAALIDMGTERVAGDIEYFIEGEPVGTLSAIFGDHIEGWTVGPSLGASEERARSDYRIVYGADGMEVGELADGASGVVFDDLYDDREAEAKAAKARKAKATRTIVKNLSAHKAKGMKVWFDPSEDWFTLMIDATTRVDFRGFQEPRIVFEVQVDFDGLEDIVHDPDQMTDFDDEMQIYEAIAKDPPKWCLEAVQVAKSRAA